MYDILYRFVSVVVSWGGGVRQFLGAEFYAKSCDSPTLFAQSMTLTPSSVRNSCALYALQRGKNNLHTPRQNTIILEIIPKYSGIYP
jgi:hypothetical protein